MINQLEHGMDKCSDFLETPEALKVHAEMQILSETKYKDSYGLSKSQIVYFDDLRDCNEGIGLPQQRAENPIEISYYEIALQSNKSYFIKGQTEEEALNTLIKVYPETLTQAVKYIRTLPKKDYDQLKLYASQHTQENINI